MSYLPEPIKLEKKSMEDCLRQCFEAPEKQHVFFNFTVESEEECDHDHDHEHHEHEHVIEEEFNTEITDERVMTIMRTLAKGDFYQEYVVDPEGRGILTNIYEVTEIIKDALGNLFIFAELVQE